MWLLDRFKNLLLVLFFLAPAGVAFFLVQSLAIEGEADFTFVNQGEVASLDPAISTAFSEGRIITALFEGLVTLDPVTLEPRPGVAERWEFTADGRVYTFFLREDARWSDGTPLTAGDFLFSWRRFLAPETAAPYAYFLWSVVEGAEAYSKGLRGGETALGLAAPDARTFIVRLRAPCPFFLYLVAIYPLCPVDRRCIEEHGEKEWLKPEKIVSNGPFRVRERRIKDRIRLEKNLHYWDSQQVALDTIDALAVESPITALNLYLTGDVDWINVVPPIAIADLRERPDFSEALNLGTNFLRFNTTCAPLEKKAVRRAIHLAIDRRELVDGVLKGDQTPATSFVPPGIPGYKPACVAGCEPSAARVALARAGYSAGEGFPELRLLYSMGETNRDLAEVIAMQLRRHLGIRVHPASQERKVYFLSQSTLDYDIVLCSWVGDYLDPSNFLEVFASGSGNNRTGWGSAGYDALLQSAASEMDTERRAGLLAEAETILLEALPITPLYYRTTTNMIKTCWEGYADNLLDVHPLKYLRRSGGS